MQSIRPGWTPALGILATLTLLGAAAGGQSSSRAALALERGRPQASSDELIALREELADVHAVSRAFKLVAKIARPGVVHIHVSGGERSDADREEHRRLREQLRDMIPPQELDRWLRRVPPGSASGFIIDREGHILTNNHVVEGRDGISVGLWDDREYPATLVGCDPKTDLAVLRIDAPDLQPLTFGDSDALEVGDWVVAVGAPFGLAQTVTHGIVSAKGRSRVAGVDISYQDFIQTDAAINPGNSGGPLLNLRGEVVGVNTAIATHGDGVNAGIAFTIPANMAVKVAEQLKTSGRVTRGYLGIVPLPLAQSDVDIFGLPDARGILVDQIVRDSPAGRGGLQVEDVIVAINDRPVESYEHFRAMVADLRPDERARLRVVRDRQVKQLAVRMGEQPEDLRARPAESAEVDRPVERLGLRVRTWRPDDRRLLRLLHDATARGVEVRDLDAETKGQLDLRAGELVVACNGNPVRSVCDLNQVVERAPLSAKVQLEILEPTGDRRVVTIAARETPKPVP